jgi:creatinine amidohydrolase
MRDVGDTSGLQPGEELAEFWIRTGPKVLWANMLRHELEAKLAAKPVVLIPLGSVEQHGPACPLDVDISIPYAVCIRATQAIEDFPCLVAPPIWWGLAPYNMGWVGTITLTAETALGVIRDVCVSLDTHGFKKLILVNGHGGNVPLMGVAATKLSEEGIYVGFTSVWELARQVMAEVVERDEGQMGHAGEMETSIQMYLRPHLLDMSRAVTASLPPGDPLGVPDSLHLIELKRQTATGVMGDGNAATVAKGRAFVEGAAAELARAARDFRDTERVAEGFAYR